jgi:hypothetical protein
MNLGDAFTRRKQIDAEIQNWINRLSLAGQDSKIYQTKRIEGDQKFVPIPGNMKTYARNYTIEECQERIKTLIDEDRQLARRISLTNQIAVGNLLDLDGKEKKLNIPELLLLRNEIGPKLENAARAIPKKATGVEIVKQDANSMNWRSIEPYYKHSQELSDKGHKIEKEYIDFYTITEVTDYGKHEREIFDETDKIHAWLERIKNAINEANKTELVEK